MNLRHSKCNVILNIPVLNNTMYNVDKKLQVKKNSPCITGRSFKVWLPQVGRISCGVGHRGGMSLLLSVLLWLSSMRWKGCEGLSNIVRNLDRILLSETSVSESSCSNTTLLPLQISFLHFLVSATLSLLPEHTTVMTIIFQVLKDNANLPGWNRNDSRCCKGPVKAQKSTKLNAVVVP